MKKFEKEIEGWKVKIQPCIYFTEEEFWQLYGVYAIPIVDGKFVCDHIDPTEVIRKYTVAPVLITKKNGYIEAIPYDYIESKESEKLMYVAYIEGYFLKDLLEDYSKFLRCEVYHIEFSKDGKSSSFTFFGKRDWEKFFKEEVLTNLKEYIQ